MPISVEVHVFQGHLADWGGVLHLNEVGLPSAHSLGDLLPNLRGKSNTSSAITLVENNVDLSSWNSDTGGKLLVSLGNGIVNLGLDLGLQMGCIDSKGGLERVSVNLTD